MKIYCPSCSSNNINNNQSFLLPLWMRVTFRINPDGREVTILHTKQLESLEEKLTDQGKTSWGLTCKECGADAVVEFREHESTLETQQQKTALEGL